MISYALNTFWVWLLFTRPAGRAGRADFPDAVRDARRDLRAQPPVGFPLMERSVYEAMAEHDERHWWYRARREVLAALICRKVRCRGREAARDRCGTGHNLEDAWPIRSVDALEVDDVARSWPKSGLAMRCFGSAA